MVCPAIITRKHKDENVADSSLERPPPVSVDNYVAPPIVYVEKNELRQISVCEDEIHIVALNPKRNKPKAIVEPMTQANPAIKTKSILEKEQDKMNQGNNNDITKPSYGNIESKQKPLVVTTARLSDNNEKEEAIYDNVVTLVKNPIKLDDLADHVNKMKTQTDNFKQEYEVNIIHTKVKYSSSLQYCHKCYQI
jgi:hypothetical protein